MLNSANITLATGVTQLQDVLAIVFMHTFAEFTPERDVAEVNIGHCYHYWWLIQLNGEPDTRHPAIHPSEQFSTIRVHH